MASDRDCHYSTRPSETRRTARKRRHQELEQRLADQETLQGMLMRHPDQSSIILNRVRTSNDPQTAIRALEAGDLLLHLAPRTHPDETAAVSSTSAASQDPQNKAQEELNQYRYLIRPLRTMPQAQAIDSLRNLREAPSPISGLQALSSTLKTELDLIRLPSVPLLRSISPPTHSNLELELQILHPSAYPSLEPFEPNSIDVDSWFRPSKPEQSRPVSSPVEHSPHTSSTGSRSGELLPSSLRHAGDSTVSAAYAWLDWELCDPRLESLRITHWTNVPIESKLASIVLSHFLTVHYPIFACFDADLFLDDLVLGNNDHCSKFLVASIMDMACVSRSRLSPLSLTNL